MILRVPLQLIQSEGWKGKGEVRAQEERMPDCTLGSGLETGSTQKLVPA